MSSRDQWQRIIAEPVWQILGDIGVESAGDVAFLLSSEDAVREWSTTSGLGAFADTLVAAWGICRKLAQEDHSVVDQIVRLERSKNSGSVSQKRSLVAGANTSRTVGPCKHRRETTTDSLTGLEEVKVVCPSSSAATPLPPVDAQREELWKLWVLSGEHNLRRQLLRQRGTEPKEGDQGLRPWVLSKFERFDEDQLKAPLRVWKRWECWRAVEAPSCSPTKPDEVTLFRFMQHVARVGPTAARSVWHQLQFLKDRLGIDLPLSDCKDFVFGQARANQVKQAKVVEPSFAVAVLCLLFKAAGPGKVLLQSVLLALLSCIRWRHLQRSYIIHSCGTLLHAHRVKGKRRVQKVRPAYSWTVPILDGLCGGVPGFHEPLDWTEGLERLYSQLAPRMPIGRDSFLIPSLRRDSSWASGEVLAVPMGFRAFTEAFRGILVQLRAKNPDKYIPLTVCVALVPPLRTFSTWIHNSAKPLAIGRMLELLAGPTQGAPSSPCEYPSQCPCVTQV